MWAALRFPGGRPPRQLPGGPVKVYIGQFKAALSMKPVLFVLGSTMFWSAGLQGMFANVGEFYRSAYSLSTGQTGLAMLPAGACSVLGNTGEPAQAHHQRSDVSAVPAAGIVAEAMVALVLADAVAEKFGGDSVAETRRNVLSYLDNLHIR